MGTKLEELVKCENGCSKAVRMPRSSDSFRSTPNSIVTIDFGTTHCSVSYLTGIKECPNPLELKPVLLTLDNAYRKRVPSCILFDKFGKTKSFGYQAREEYASLDIKVRPGYAFFEHVKKEIQRKEDVDRNHNIPAMNGKQYFLIDVIAHILCYLKKKILQIICDVGLDTTTPKVTDIDWVITVPAIWKTRGKQMMREAGYMAGLCDACVTMEPLTEVAGRVQPPPKVESNPQRLSLALEPESAAIECKKTIEKAQKRVKTYLIVDCGGGTVDIATHEIIHGHVHELAPSAGDMNGGTTINERFRYYLSCFVSDPGFTKYFSECDDTERAKRVSDINKIVYTAFEDQKLCFGDQEGRDNFVVEFPIAFSHKFHELMVEKQRSLNHSNVQIEEFGSKMRLTGVKMAEFFQPTIDKISELICNHIHTKGLASVIDTIFWVGAFGGCKYLRRKLETAINSDSRIKRKIQPVCPIEPQLAVIRGALAFRCDPGVIQQRKANATYGVNCRIPFLSKHRTDFRVDDEDDRSKKWCTNIFLTFIERNDSICTNEVFVAKFTPSSRSQKTAQFIVYRAPCKDVWYTTDPGVKRLAKIDVNIAGSGRDREIEVVFDITHTEIQVCARDKQSKNEYKIVVDFLFSEQ